MTALRRVRPEEWLVGVLSLALLAVLFDSGWYRVGPYGPLGGFYYRDVSGWDSLSILGPLAVAVAAGGLALVILQAARPAPALPVSVSAIEMLLSFVLMLGLVVRVLIDHPALKFKSPFLSVVHVRFGGYAALGLALALVVGSYLSLRSDGTPATAPDPQRIETLRVGPRSATP